MSRLLTALLFATMLFAVSGCGGDDNTGNDANLDKPALTIPEGSVEASSSKKGETGETGETAATTGGSDTSTGTGTDTGGAGTGTGTDTGGGTDTGTDTGGADNTGGAAPGN